MAALVVCVVLRVAAAGLTWRAGFRALGDDDFSKMSVSLGWAGRPSLFPHAIWLPLDFWTVGAASYALPTVYGAAIAVNMAFGLAALVVVFLWARRFMGDVAAGVGCALLAIYPWLVWTSLTPPGEAAYVALVAAAVVFLFQWQRTGRTGALWGVGVALLFANAARHQGWLFSLLVVGYVVVRMVREPELRGRVGGIMPALVVPFSVPALYMLWLWGSYGHPLYFRHGVVGTYARMYEGVGSVLVRLVQPLVLVAVAGLPYAAAGVAGIVRLWRGGHPQRGLWTWLALGYLGVLSVAMGVGGLESQYAPQRYILPVVVLMSPLVGGVVVAAWRRWRVVGAVLAVVLAAWQGASCLRYPREFSGEEQVAAYLRQLWKAGVLKPEERLVVMDRRPFQGRAIAFLSGEPQRFLFYDFMPDKSPFRAVFDGADNERTRAMVERERIGAVLVTWKQQAERIGDYMRQYGAVCGYKIFVRTDSVLPPPPEPVVVRHRRTEILEMNTVVCPGTRLLQVRTDAGRMSREVYFRWRVERSGGDGGRVNLHLENVVTGERGAAVRLEVNGGFAVPDGVPMETSDALALTIPRGAQAGLYRLQVACPDRPEERVGLGEFYLMRSKRVVLMELLRGDFSNWRIALSILASVLT